MRRIFLLCCLFLLSCEFGPPQGEPGNWQLVWEPAEEAYFQAIYFADRWHGWAVGDSGTIIHTADGGYTWEYQQSGTTTNLQDVYFIDSETGWAAGYNNTIIHTTNGGKSWALLFRPEDDYPAFRDIFFVDETLGYALGLWGAIYRISIP